MSTIYQSGMTGAGSKFKAFNAVLAAAAVLICYWIFTIWTTPFVSTQSATAHAPGISGKAVETKLPSRSSYSVIVDKDLFRPSRKKYVAPKPVKPVVAAPVALPPPPKPVPRLTLVGTVLLDDEQAAIIRNAGADEQTYKVGDSIEGFVIKEINKESVLLDRDGEVLNVTMDNAAVSTQQLPGQMRTNPRLPAATPQFRGRITPGGAPQPPSR